MWKFIAGKTKTKQKNELFNTGSLSPARGRPPISSGRWKLPSLRYGGAPDPLPCSATDNNHASNIFNSKAWSVTRTVSEGVHECRRVQWFTFVFYRAFTAWDALYRKRAFRLIPKILSRGRPFSFGMIVILCESSMYVIVVYLFSSRVHRYWRVLSSRVSAYPIWFAAAVYGVCFGSIIAPRVASKIYSEPIRFPRCLSTRS